MEWTTKHFVVLGIAAVFILKKALANTPFVKRYNNLITLLVIISLAAFICVEFWQVNAYIFYGSIVLAIMATYYVVREEIKARKTK